MDRRCSYSGAARRPARNAVGRLGARGTDRVRPPAGRLRQGRGGAVGRIGALELLGVPEGPDEALDQLPGGVVAAEVNRLNALFEQYPALGGGALIRRDDDPCHGFPYARIGLTVWGAAGPGAARPTQPRGGGDERHAASRSRGG